MPFEVCQGVTGVEIKINGFVEIIVLQGQSARAVISANVTMTNKGRRGEEIWGLHATGRGRQKRAT